MKLDPKTDAAVRRAAGQQPKPKNPVLALPKESELEIAFDVLWKRHGNGQEPKREFQFDLANGRRWAFDFAWPDRLLAVELEGIFRFGDQTRHQTAAGFEADLEKYNRATELGWRVIRFTRTDLEKRPVETVELVKRILEGGR